MADDVSRDQPAPQRSANINKRIVRALVIGPTAEKVEAIRKAAAGNEEPGKTKQLPEDPFAMITDIDLLIEPPFDMLTLSMLTEHNTEMGPCLDAMEVNVDGLGHRLVPRTRLGKDTPEDVKKEVDAERVRLENFFAYFSVDDSFTAFRRKVRRDMESTGNAFAEVIRGPAGDVQGMEHAPSYLCRLCRQEEKPFKCEVPQLELQADGSVKIVKRMIYKRFRTYAMLRLVQRRGGVATASSGEVVWFKEFGDPRVYDQRSGKVDPNTPEEHRANEMVHWRIYTARSPYGLPRYIGNLLSIFGARAAEEINFLTFRNNNIPSMAVLVSNGQLTEGTVQRIQDFVESQIQGSENYSKFLIVEAESSTESLDGGEDVGNMRLEIKPLTKDQHTDALFVNYQTNAQSNVRRSWRLPPIFLGMASDYTRSTAEEGRKLTDEQVFAPERDETDSWFNRKLFPVLGVLHHRFRSNSPNTTDTQELIKILSDGEKTGGVNPEIARAILEEVLGRDLPDFPENFPKDLPFSLLMAAAVKNEGQPNVPAQQVTAVKDGDSPANDRRIHDPVGHVHSLIDLRRLLEQQWAGLMGDAHEEPADGEPQGADDSKIA